MAEDTASILVLNKYQTPEKLCYIGGDVFGAKTEEATTTITHVWRMMRTLSNRPCPWEGKKSTTAY